MTKTCTFGGLRVDYDSSLLAPRDWTKAQSMWAREVLSDLPPGPVLEVCSGAGQIGLLAVVGTGRHLVCVDVNPAAARFAARNARAAAVSVDTRVGRACDVLKADERFGLIIADPPWVDTHQTPRFPDDPPPAIDGGPDGLRVTRECLQVAARHLIDGGVLLLQVAAGAKQADAVERIKDDSLVVRERRHFPRGTLLRLDAVGAHAASVNL